MEGIVAPPDVDREIYRVALGGAGTEEPYWQGGDLHEYGAWWLVEQLEHDHPGFVRRLLALAATRGDDDPRRAEAARRERSAAGARSRPRSSASRARRSTIRWSARPCAPGARPGCAPGGRLVLRASVQPLSLRLWRVPATAAAVTLRRAGGRRARQSWCGAARPSASLGGARRCACAAGAGSLLVLVVGGGGGTQDVRLTLTGAR